MGQMIGTGDQLWETGGRNGCHWGNGGFSIRIPQCLVSDYSEVEYLSFCIVMDWIVCPLHFYVKNLKQKGKIGTDTHRENICADGGRDWGDASASQKMPKIDSKAPEAGEKPGTDFPSPPSEGGTNLLIPGSHLLASRTVMSHNIFLLLKFSWW